MEQKKIIKKFKGTVVSTKMAKTAVVVVDDFKMHPKYKKRYKVSKKYKVHDAESSAKVGDVVEFIECRPLSKDKKWRLVTKS
jgi:small subunit ribosomal protein S17